MVWIWTHTMIVFFGILVMDIITIGLMTACIRTPAGTITLLWYCTCCGAQWDDVYTFVRRENLKLNPED